MDVSLKSLETGFSWKKMRKSMGFFNLEALDFETYQNDVFFFLPPENKRLEPPQTVPSI